MDKKQTVAGVESRGGKRGYSWDTEPDYKSFVRAAGASTGGAATGLSLSGLTASQSLSESLMSGGTLLLSVGLLAYSIYCIRKVDQARLEDRKSISLDTRRKGNLARPR